MRTSKSMVDSRDDLEDDDSGEEEEERMMKTSVGPRWFVSTLSIPNATIYLTQFVYGKYFC